MEDVFDAAWREHPASHDTQVDAELASLIDIRGLGLVDDAAQLRQLLLQACPDAQRHIGALLAALTAQVPTRLIAAKDDDTLPELLRGSIRHLQEQAGLDADWAEWAVRAWAHAFALPTAGLDGPGVVAAAALPSFASPIASARPPRADGFDHVGAGTIGGLWDRSPVRATDPQPASRDAREPTLRNTEDFAAARSEPGFAIEAGAEPSPVPPPHFDEGPMLVEPLFPDRSAESLAPATPEDDAIAPTWVDHARPAELRTRSMAGPVVMVTLVLVVAAIAWFALEGTPWSTPATGTPSSSPAPSAAATNAPTTAPTTPSVAATPPPPTTAPDTAQNEAAAGQPGGNAAAPPATTGNDATSTAGAPETAPATPAPVASAPVEADAARPSPARRPAISRVDVPSIVEGAPFAVGIQFGTSVRDVASVERRVVDSGGAWPKMPTQFQASGLQRSSDRMLLVPFRAMDAPSHATVEFVAIGRDGVRSEARRVTIALNQPDPAIAALEIPAACTSATCGVVVESREIEPEVGTRGAIYQLTVRMDDRQMVTSTAPYRLQVGSRARLAGTRFVPVDRKAP